MNADQVVAAGTVVLAVATVALVAVTVGLAVVGARGLRDARAELTQRLQDQQRDHLHARARETMKVIWDWRSVSAQAFDEIYLMYDIKDQSELPVAFVQHQNDRNFQRRVRRVVELVEHLSLGTRNGAYDADIVYNLARGWIATAWTIFRPYVIQRRVGSGRPSIYEHFEWLNSELARMEADALAKQEEPPVPGRLPEPPAGTPES